MTITATEEEKAVISSGNLGNFEIFALPLYVGSSEHDYTADMLLSQTVLSTSANKWHANNVAREMRNAAAKLKSLIEETLADETGEFDL